MSKSLSPELLAVIERHLDERHHQFETLGGLLFKEFRPDRQGPISAQVRNLQQTVTSATRLSDVEDFVKNQMGRETQSGRPWRKVGPEVLTHLDELRRLAGELAEAPDTQLQVRLRLARGWVRAVVSEYLFQKALS
jgi:hypothetical protein